jgi:ketosteroid isomerase-like protein
VSQANVETLRDAYEWVRLHDVGDKVVAILRVRGRSRMSETAIEMSMAHVVTFRDGKQARTENYSGPREALKAMGLEQ